ncbi:magnesium transporter [Nakamurella panacisegetis]|uniref:Magnesium transporter n=1 Tax=Nakamurella panacisegetis TaxID=1090615 RepID=A0A1H0P571_9ACTN|nr:magnesium transporter CorA family protein [Nakamurella panacisegetis]SDO99830.1 magnesium transporter [Nakamurella panacisegetis]
MSGQAWNDNGFLEADDSAAQVRELLRTDPTSKAWLFLPRHETDALDQAATHLGIDALAIEDILGEREPMKLDWIDSTLVAVLRWVSFDVTTGELTALPVSVLAGPRAVIVLTDEEHCRELADVLRKRGPAILSDGIPAALHAVVDTVVDAITAVLLVMEDAVDKLSETLFDDRPLIKAEQLYAFRVRRALAHLRRVTTPMRDIAAGLANAAGRAAARHNTDDPEPTDDAERLLGLRSVREFSDVADHAEHAGQNADGLRDVISSMYETNLALADVHLNTVMKKLTGWAAIIAVPTLITGFMGMNVPYPGFQSEVGFLIAFVVMITAVLTLFVTLRRRDWI